MTDILVRNLDDAVVELIDRHAAAAGLSRAEFLRRTIEREARRGVEQVDVSHLTRFSVLATDLEDPEVMGEAWS